MAPYQMLIQAGPSIGWAMIKSIKTECTGKGTEMENPSA